MQKVRSYSLISYYWQMLSLSVLIFLMAGLFFVAPNVVALGSDISKSYSGDDSIVAGSLVSLDGNKLGYIVLANAKNNNQLIGVAVNKNGSLIAIDQKDNKIQVSINGSALTLVSNINGDIKTGDFIGQSAISGVGAKALAGDKTVGIAQAPFSSTSVNSRLEIIKDSNGGEKQVNIGQIPVLVSAGSAASNSSESLSNLEIWANKLVGHKVSMMRIVFCVIIAIIAIVSMIIMVYSSIRNAIMAVSRNPLAKPMIFEALAQVLLMILIISVISITTMYLVIRV